MSSSQEGDASAKGLSSYADGMHLIILDLVSSSSEETVISSGEHPLTYATVLGVVAVSWFAVCGSVCEGWGELALSMDLMFCRVCARCRLTRQIVQLDGSSNSIW